MLLQFLHTIGHLPRCFAGTLLLPLCLLLRPILKFWSVGAALLRFTWANVSERRILVSNFGVMRNSLRGSYTLDWSLHVCALPENGLRRCHVLKYTTQLSCIGGSTLRRTSFQLVITFLAKLPCSIVTLVGDMSSFMQIILLQHSYCTLVIILFGPFTGLFINLTVCIRALFPNRQPLLVLWNKHSGGYRLSQNELLQVPVR